MLGYALQAAGAVVAGSAVWAFFWLRSHLKYTHPDRKVEFSCRCGKIKAEVKCPYADSPKAECYCDDCTEFFQWMKEKKCPIDFKKELPVGIQIYKSDFKFIKGADQIQCTKLKPGSHLHRFYSKCCNCPLWLSPNLSAYPMLITYNTNFPENGADFGQVWWHLNSEKAPKGSIPPNTTAVKAKGLPAGFFGVTIGRALTGIACGKTQPNPLEEIDLTNPEIKNP